MHSDETRLVQFLLFIAIEKIANGSVVCTTYNVSDGDDAQGAQTIYPSEIETIRSNHR